MEKTLFDAIYKYDTGNPNWKDFSKELLDSLSKEEINLFKSKSSSNKFGIFESSDRIGQLLEYSTDLKVLLEKLKDLSIADNGWGKYSSNFPLYGEVYKQWHFLYTESSDSFILNEKEILKVNYMNSNSYKTSKKEQKDLINSINTVYEYVFSSKPFNKVPNFLKANFIDNTFTYKTFWSDLLYKVVSMGDRGLKAMDIINWNMEKLKDHKHLNLLKSGKNISKFNV